MFIKILHVCFEQIVKDRDDDDESHSSGGTAYVTVSTSFMIWCVSLCSPSEKCLSTVLSHFGFVCYYAVIARCVCYGLMCL